MKTVEKSDEVLWSRILPETIIINQINGTRVVGLEVNRMDLLTSMLFVFIVLDQQPFFDEPSFSPILNSLLPLSEKPKKKSFIIYGDETKAERNGFYLFLVLFKHRKRLKMISELRSKFQISLLLIETLESGKELLFRR